MPNADTSAACKASAPGAPVRKASARPRQPAVQPCFASAHNSHAAVAANETLRRLKHGRIRPMHQPSLIERLLGW